MAVTYQNLLHNIALRLSALVGTQITGINTSYNTPVLTAGQFKSVDWPFESFRDTILMAEGQFAEVAAYSVDSQGIGNHSWRSSMADVTPALANGAQVPSTGSTGSRIIGAYGEVIDSTDNVILTRQPLEDVRRIKAETWRVYPLYLYDFAGRRIFHTRTAVVVGVCVYNRVTQLATFTANGPMLLPDTAEAGITALAISLMVRETAFADQASYYAKYAAEALQMVAKGGIPSALPAAA